MLLIDHFEQMRRVDVIFDFLYNQENLLREYDHNRLLTACQNMYKTMGNIFDPLEINDELEGFVVIVRKKNFSDIYVSKTTIHSLSKLVYSSSSFADMPSSLDGRC